MYAYILGVGIRIEECPTNHFCALQVALVHVRQQ